MLPEDFLEDALLSVGEECDTVVHVKYDPNQRISIKFKWTENEVTLLVSDYLKDIDEYVNPVTGLHDGLNILGDVLSNLVRRTRFGLGPDPGSFARIWEILETEKWRNDHISTYLSRLNYDERGSPAFKTLIHFLSGHNVVVVKEVNSMSTWFEYSKAFRTLCITPECVMTDDQALALTDIINDVDEGLVEGNIISELRRRHPELLVGLTRPPEEPPEEE